MVKAGKGGRPIRGQGGTGLILPLDKAHRFQLQDHLMRAVININVFCVDHKFGC
ncbi:MAG: hypothetical protein RLZZ437_3476, partial [Pseudomonadota bacterium]